MRPTLALHARRTFIASTPGALEIQRRAEGEFRLHFFLPPRSPAPLVGCAKGDEACGVFGFSFFGFFASRFPRCWPFAMYQHPFTTTQEMGWRTIQARPPLSYWSGEMDPRRSLPTSGIRSAPPPLSTSETKMSKAREANAANALIRDPGSSG